MSRRDSLDYLRYSSGNKTPPLYSSGSYSPTRYRPSSPLTSRYSSPPASSPFRGRPSSPRPYATRSYAKRSYSPTGRLSSRDSYSSFRGSKMTSDPDSHPFNYGATLSQAYDKNDGTPMRGPNHSRTYMPPLDKPTPSYSRLSCKPANMYERDSTSGASLLDSFASTPLPSSYGTGTGKYDGLGGDYAALERKESRIAGAATVSTDEFYGSGGYGDFGERSVGRKSRYDYGSTPSPERYGSGYGKYGSKYDTYGSKYGSGKYC